MIRTSDKVSNRGEGGNPGSTSGTLIRCWRRQEPEAWERLTYLYFPLIYQWCRRKGLMPEDARDVSQNVFLSLSKCTMRFQPGEGANSFRGWLWGVTNNHIKYYLRQESSQPSAVGGSTAVRRMADVAQEAEPAGLESEEMASRTGEQGLLKRALELLRTDFQEPTWRAFWQTTMESRPAAEVAAELGLSTNAVYLAKSRVLRRLRQEFEGQLETGS